jgi:hypothetical protein
MKRTDLIGQWVEEKCIQKAGAWTPTHELLDAFEEWCDAQGIPDVSAIQSFGQCLAGLGFTPRVLRRRAGIEGIVLKGREPQTIRPRMCVAGKSVREFLTTRARIEPGNTTWLVQTAVIHSAYLAWAKKHGHPALTCRDFGWLLGRVGLGLRPHLGYRGRGWQGIVLLGGEK